MKKTSKILTFSAAAALTLSLSLHSFAAALPFTDVDSSPAKDKILSLQEKGVVNGIGNARFAPDASLTAAQGIQLIVGALHLNIDNIRFIKKPEATDYFKNADNNAWYADAFIIAPLNGMDLPNDLDPNAKWTREQFTYYLIHAAEVKYNLPMVKIAPPPITDINAITTDFSGAIQRALIYKVTELDADGNFNPKSEIKRADAAELTYNMLAYIDAHAIQPAAQ